MTSDTHDVLSGDKAEWDRAERAVDRLIAARHNLIGAGGDADGREGRVDAAAPAAPAASPAVRESEPAVQPPRPYWPTIILLAVVWVSVAIVVSAAILSVATLL